MYQNVLPEHFAPVTLLRKFNHKKHRLLLFTPISRYFFLFFSTFKDKSAQVTKVFHTFVELK